MQDWLTGNNWRNPGRRGRPPLAPAHQRPQGLLRLWAALPISNADEPAATFMTSLVETQATPR